ncbi:MAG: Flp pilus assembly protein CpaB [Candidatus Omnitrophica bacterium]|nr:Flp pilus assembly protein CpaB [Candidatus Omnitrophota bacterium]
MQRKFILAAAIILGIISVFLINTYMTQQKKIYEAKVKETLTDIRSNQRQVLVATQDILRGAVIKSSSVKVKSIPADFVQPSAATSLERILGMVAVVPIAKGEQITLSKLSYPSQSRSLSMAIPVGKRAITVYLDDISSVGGMIKPGDYVDVISVVPIPQRTPEGKTVMQAAVIPLFQKVLVLAVGKNIGGVSASSSEGKGGIFSGQLKKLSSAKRETSTKASHYITLALSPQEANYVALVQQQGKLQLVLRSPADAQLEEAKPANIESLLEYLNLLHKETKKVISPKKVEIYRGTKKEVVTLQK